MGTVCGVKTGVQALPSVERKALKSLPERVSFSQRGGKVLPALGPSLAVAPFSVVRRRNLAFPSVVTIIVAWTEPAVSFSRIITPASEKVAPDGLARPE